MKKLNSLLIIPIFFVVFAGACATRTAYVKKQPPQKKIELKVVKPEGNYIWVEGHWDWSRAQKRYVWKKGHWKKNKKNNVWVSGHWKKTPKGWIWIHGYWK